ncbi:hypothetical protein D5086_017170 [Populus alba]|uniref:Uncharacterized protein n=1 Tax=Populus alba TaxID=43335 RepID=A0ACC4BW06_POPAL
MLPMENFQLPTRPGSWEIDQDREHASALRQQSQMISGERQSIQIQRLSSLPEYKRWPASSAKHTVLTSDCMRNKHKITTYPKTLSPARDLLPQQLQLSCVAVSNQQPSLLLSSRSSSIKSPKQQFLLSRDHSSSSSSVTSHEVKTATSPP